MSFHIIPTIQLQQSNLSLFTDIVFKNFVHLDSPEILHNHQEILRGLKSPFAQVYFYLVNDKIAAYLTGETMHLYGRHVFYITYLYTSKMFRKQGFAHKFIDYVDKYVKQHSLDGAMLTCAKANTVAYNFYIKKGYTVDKINPGTLNYSVLFKA